MKNMRSIINIIYKVLVVMFIISILFSQKLIYASMADFTDEQADENLKQEQEEFKKEQEERINKSSNNYLKNLSVEGYSITPEFDKQTINYEIIQEITADNLEIKAEADDEKAKISGVGKITLNSGENNIKIDVEAENGTVRSYFIKVIKSIKKDINIRLNSLKIIIEDSQDIEISPEFNKDIYEYNCEVESYVEKVNIKADSDTENANIKIEGNEQLKEGLNEVLITVSADNEEKVIYKVNITKKQSTQIIEDKKSGFSFENVYLPTIIVLVIIIVISLLKRRKKGKHNK